MDCVLVTKDQFDEVWNDSFSELSELARAKAGRSFDPDEIVNKIWLLANKKFKKNTFKDLSHVKNYLFHVIQFVAIECYENSQPLTRKRISESLPEICKFENLDFWLDLDDYLNDLNEAQRNVLEMRIVGMQYKEISKALGIKKSTARAIKRRAIEKIIKFKEEYVNE